jgi:hypothetical protein
VTSFRTRLHVERLEEIAVPAAFSLQFQDGSVVSGQFSSPSGVNPAQPTQALPLTDLTVTRGANTYTVTNAQGLYNGGVLTGVSGVAQYLNNGAPVDTINLNGARAIDGGYSGALVLDAADTQGQRVFFLPGFLGFSARSAVENHRFFGVNHHETLGFPAI